MERPQFKTDYPTIVLFFIMTVATVIGVPLFGYVYGFSTLDWTMFVVLYLITGLGITVGYHRLISHRSFECKPWVKGCLLIAGGWALENSALRWCSDHIRHHARCDGQEDPYNATKGFWYSHCGWLFTKSPYREEKYEKTLRKDALIMWQDRYYLPIVLSGLALPFVVGFLYGGWMSGLSCFILAGVGRTFFVLNSTFCINSICHMWGDQPHGTGDSSRDSWWISLLTFGEGYHNYHHMFLRDYRNGAEWYHFDPSKWLIFTLSKLRLAYNLQRHQA
ncbi:MAG: fatty acid desaturase [Nitrospirales bacterium]